MSNLKEITDTYNSLLDKEIEQVKATIKESAVSTYTYGKLIMSLLEHVDDIKIIRYIKEVMSNNTKEFNYSKLVAYSKDIEIRNHMLTKQANEKTRMFVVYYNTFIKEALKYTYNIELLDELDTQRLSDKVIYETIRQYGWQAQIELLENGSIIALGELVYLRIRRKYRVHRKLVGKSKHKVDWGESVKKLIELTKEYDYDTYVKYKDKEINKAQLIDNAKSFTYNAKDNPNAPKWLVYDDKEFDFWLIMNTHDSPLKYIDNYSVVPVNHISTKDRSQANFLKGVTCREDIILSKDLGFRDKLFMLEKFDLQHCLTHYETW